MTRVRPPPPPERVQASSRNREPPSAASRPAVMRSWRSLKYSATRSSNVICFSSSPSRWSRRAGFERFDAAGDVTELAAALRDLLEKVQRLAGVAHALERAAEQVIELRRLGVSDGPAVERLFVADDGVRQRALRVQAFADHRERENFTRRIADEQLEFGDGGVVETHFLVRDAEIAVSREIRFRASRHDGHGHSRTRATVHAGRRPRLV